MALEKATAIVLRTTDWSETSRIATLWTREFGKVRVLAKGGRRLRSAFESALDLLTLCSIVLIRKSSGGLDLLTEAVVLQRFPALAKDLASLYAAYYVAELLGDYTEENDPHPNLFDNALNVLRAIGTEPRDPSRVALWVMRFELGFLGELGFTPRLQNCVGCGVPITDTARGIFSVEAGGLVCTRCQLSHRDRQGLSGAALETLRALADTDERWREVGGKHEHSDAELRRVLGQYLTYRLGRRPRLLSYLEGLTRE
jgi:DNA repair protein RecO (recombination protein O)